MRILSVDARAGASADMLLAALLDVGVPTRVVERAVRPWLAGGAGIRRERVGDRRMRGLRLRFEVRSRRPLPRVAGVVVRAVERSGLPPALRRRIARVWKVLAAAEARAHGVGWRRVRFHQVGGADTWVCFAGFCAGLAHLRVGKVFVGPVRLGWFHHDHAGRASRTPGPATLRLLRRFRVVRARDRFEWTTPTGAALLAAFGVAAAAPPFRVLAIGHGFGRAQPLTGGGALRLILAEAVESR